MEIKIKHHGFNQWQVTLWSGTDMRYDKTVIGLPALIHEVLYHALAILR